MKIPFTDLQSEYRECKWQIDEAIQHCLSTNSFLTGPDVAEFEQVFSDYTGSEDCASCASGTAALQLALRACGIGKRDEVITVSYTFVSTVEAICSVGAKPVFVDVNKHGLININQIESAITERTKAVVWVDLYGQSPDINQILKLCKTHGLYSIQDAAQSFGYEYKNRRIGGLADITCFSFNPVKNLGAIGDAGCVTGRADLVALARSYAHHGRDKERVYQRIGYNLRIDNVQAKVIQAKLPKLKGWLKRKNEIGDYYTERFKKDYIVPKQMAWGKHTYYVYVLQHPYRDRVRAKLADRGIGTALHYETPVHTAPAYKKFRKSLPVSELLSTEVFSIPIYPQLRDSQVDYIVQQVLDCV